MFIAQLNDDLIYQLSTIPLLDAPDTEKLARERFFKLYLILQIHLIKKMNLQLKILNILFKFGMKAFQKLFLGIQLSLI